MEDLIHLTANDTTLTANKALLVQHSPYFRAMFRDHFIEENKTEIDLHGVDPESLQLLLDWTTSSTIPQLSTQATMDLVQCAGMLQFAEVQRICVETLCTRVDRNNCWSLMEFADLVAETNLLQKTQVFILWNFETAVTATEFSSVDLKLLVEILKNRKLNVRCEMQVFDAIVNWIGSDDDKIIHFPELVRQCIYFENLSAENIELICNQDLVKRDQQLKDDIIEFIKYKAKSDSEKSEYKLSKEMSKMVKQHTNRSLPSYPCVIGHISNKLSNKDTKRTDEEELDDWNQMGVRASKYMSGAKQKSVHMFMWDPDAREVKKLGPVNNVQDGEVEASGFKVAGTGVELLLSGGEFSLGHSNWHKSITKWDSFKRRWENLTTMETVRRHHTMVIMDRVLYLLGGFGKHRIILDSVDAINLDTGDLVECASLPVPLYRPAAAVFRGRIFVFGKKMGSVYHPYPQNYWASLTNINLPGDVEFDNAMASDTHIYLTSSHRRELFRFDPGNENSHSNVELVGKFNKEANNTCIASDIIYNFNSEEFDDERTVESFDIKTSRFQVLWKKDVPEWDFSPHYCLGCFPIVDYYADHLDENML